MITQVLEIIKTKTVNHSLITISGTLVNGLLGMVFFILLARSLGPEIFGIVSVSILVLTLVADIADLGINTGLINFISRYISSDQERAFKIMKLSLEVKLVIGLTVALIGWILAPFAAQFLFLKPELTLPLRLALIGVLGSLLFSFITSSLQALQCFAKWSLLNILSNGLRLGIAFVLTLIISLNLYSSLILYILVPLFGFFMGLWFLPKGFLRVSNEITAGREVFNYNRWVAISILLAAASSRMDTFISARLLSVNEVGIYSAANQLTSVIPQLVFAIATVVAPKLASYRDNKSAAAYLKKVQLLVTGLAVLGLVFLPIAAYLIPLLYGDSYQGAILPFVILFVGQIFFLLALPAHQAIFYYFSKPNIFTLLSFAQLIFVTIIGWYLIQLIGVVGAALTVLLSNILLFIIPNTWVIILLRKKSS